MKCAFLSFVACSLLLAPCSLLFAADHQGKDTSITDQSTGDKAKINLHDNSDGTFSASVYVVNPGGGGGGGDASAANQTAVEANAGSDATKAVAVQGVTSGKAVKVDGSAVTQPVSASSLPLPSGASTSANQSTANSSLSTIATNSGNIPAKGAATTANSLPVNIASDQTVSVTANPPTFTANNDNTTTSGTGSDWVTLASHSCKQVTIINTTGAAISVRYGSGTAVSIPDQTSYPFLGLTNSNGLQIQRTDASNTTVSVAWNWVSW